MKRTVRFYTKEEINRIKALIKTGMPIVKIVKLFSKESKRPVQGVYQKVLTLTPKNKKDKRGRKPSIKKQLTEKGIVMPEGFTFDFAPKRAEMHKNKVVLYF